MKKRSDWHLSKYSARKYRHHWVAVARTGKVIHADKRPDRFFKWLQSHKHPPVTVFYLSWPLLPFAYMVRKSVKPKKMEDLVIRLGRRKFRTVARSAARDLDQAILTTGPGRTNSVTSEDLVRIDHEFKRIRKVRG